MTYKTITQESYNKTATEYAEKVQHLSPTHSIERFLSLISLKSPRILDIGCGSGRDAHIFTNKGAQVVGIDFSSSLISLAKHHVPDAEFYIMDMEEITLPNNSFDGIWASSSLLHLSKSSISSVLRKMYDLLRQDGWLYLTLKNGSGEFLERDTRYSGDIIKFWALYEKEEIETFLRFAQFTIHEVSLIEKTHEYQTHPFLRIFCQKK